MTVRVSPLNLMLYPITHVNAGSFSKLPLELIFKIFDYSKISPSMAWVSKSFKVIYLVYDMDQLIDLLFLSSYYEKTIEKLKSLKSFMAKGENDSLIKDKLVTFFSHNFSLGQIKQIESQFPRKSMFTKALRIARLSKELDQIKDQEDRVCNIAAKFNALFEYEKTKYAASFVVNREKKDCIFYTIAISSNYSRNQILEAVSLISSQREKERALKHLDKKNEGRVMQPSNKICKQLF